MIVIQILESDDIVEPDMFCRPLSFERDEDGGIREKSPWGSRPINNLRWIPVRAVLGECWWHQPLSVIRQKARWNYEVMQGTLPLGHRMVR